MEKKETIEFLEQIETLDYCIKLMRKQYWSMFRRSGNSYKMRDNLEDIKRELINR